MIESRVRIMPPRTPGLPRSNGTQAVSVLMALLIIASGTGLPMCFTLLGRPTTPCDVHSSHGRDVPDGHAHPGASVATTMSTDSCHDAGSTACSTTSCPTAGPATTGGIAPSVWERAPSLVGVVGPASTFTSYRAPPLSPPPQA